MTATTVRAPKPAQYFLTNGLPQVNLLPPEVRAARGLVVAKRWLGATLVLVLALAGLGYGGAVFLKQAAETDLVAAQQETALLQAEEATYAEVPSVLTNLTRGETALGIAMSPEILWKGYIDAIAAVLPSGVGLTTFMIMQGTATAAAPAPPDSLASQGVASISFSSSVLTIPDNAAWQDALNLIPGFYAATVSSVTLGGDGNVVVYDVSTTVQVDKTAFSNRFTAERN